MNERRHRIAIASLAVAALLLVYAVSTQVFPYHTSNHDEAVYLTQAAMLLEGKLFLEPPVADVFRPWFFVRDGGRLYPKYSPVPAAMFAVGAVLGSVRFALALIAAGVVALTGFTVSAVFDRETGVLAGVLLLGSPLFLVDASVFLPYVATMFWNLAFAVAYFHADRTGSCRSAAVAGGAIGVAFFARPFTALLFAAPFIVHACWTLRTRDRTILVRQGVIAALGLLGVAITLGYNAVVTGDPFLFPYEAFAPRDGLGFGHREILNYSREYTPLLALRSNAAALWVYATKWVVAGAVGALATIVGLAVALRRGLTAHQATLAGLFVSVPVGNLFFWGTLNTLGELGRAGDGLVHYLGPFYHVDLLLPTVAFAAVGLRACWTTVARDLDSRSWAGPRHTLAVLIVCSAALGTAGLGMAAAPVADNQAVTERYEQAYEPFDRRSLEDSVVFLPTPYGDWLGHPFQALRNDPGIDGDTVYALDGRPFAVADAYPDRTLYRYTYRGAWAPTAGRSVEPQLRRIDHVEGESVRYAVELGVPQQAERVSIRLAGEDDSAYASATPDENDSVQLAVNVTDGKATLVGDDPESASISLGARETLVLTAFVDYGTGAGFHYRFEMPVESQNSTVRSLTPRREVCHDARLCDGEAAYVSGTHRDGVWIETNLTAHD